jgi:hypothetical protein
MTKPSWSGYFLLLAVLAGAATEAVGHFRPARARSLRTACWYWHRPFHLTAAEQRQLRAARIERLYVYAGTLEARGATVALTRPQRWSSRAPCELYAVIRVHLAANAALLSPEGAARAAALIRSEAHLGSAPGIQWDADIPTSRLSDYVRFLQEFRPLMPPGQALSVTALPDWLRSEEYARLCDAVDEVAPQFYGNQWPEPGRRPPALWETRGLMEAISRSARGRARVWIGLPAYGQCLVVDAGGRPVGLRHDLDPDRLLEDPAWEVQARETRCAQWGAGEQRVPVEDTLALRCREEALAGPLEAPAGTWLWFQWPRVEGLRAAIQAIRSRAPAGVEGICLFRWPAPDEPLALPAAQIAAVGRAAERKSEPRTGLQIRLARAGPTVRVVVANTSADSPCLDQGISLELRPPPGAEIAADAPVSWLRGEEPASARRGDRAIFTRPLLRQGRQWEVCQVLHCAGPVRATLRWAGSDGAREARAETGSGASASTSETQRAGDDDALAE